MQYTVTWGHGGCRWQRIPQGQLQSDAPARNKAHRDAEEFVHLLWYINVVEKIRAKNQLHHASLRFRRDVDNSTVCLLWGILDIVGDRQHTFFLLIPSLKQYLGTYDITYDIKAVPIILECLSYIPVFNDTLERLSLGLLG